MRLSAFVAALLVSALILSAGGPSAYALNKNNHKAATAKVVTKVESKTVKVNEGDNLSTIADQNKTTFQRLFDANTKITDPNMIYPGDELRIPAPDEQLTSRPLPENYVPPVAAAPVAAPKAQAKALAAPVVAAPAIQSSPVSGCGDNQYANFIYSHESGCRTTASSPNGCYGIGQACPAGKIAYCGADYDCQNAFFTSYANKYGGWEGAYNFWTSHGWW